MQILKSRPALRRGRIIYLSPDELASNPIQPRKSFDETELRELSESIREYGIINPLTVRWRGGGYELIAGERRLRAARLAGLTEVPCNLLDVSIEESSLLALVENLQRRDLDFLEEAEGLQQLVCVFGLSQEEAARRIGKSQSAVANKLRLLRLPRDVLTALRENGLSERHGRALLRLPSERLQREVLAYILENDLTVAASEAYIEKLLQTPETPEEDKPAPHRSFVLKDVRVFLNTLTRSLDLMKQGGIDAGMKREETDDALILTISIPKSKKPEQERA